MGPCIANCRVSAFSLKLIPRKMPNPDMATTSSAAQADMTRVGMPLATPKPLSERLMRQGMMTAGGDGGEDKSEHEADGPGEAEDEVG